LKAVVTGGCGFIGSHLVDRLVEEGFERIIVIDNLSSGTLDNVKAHLDEDYFTLVRADLKDAEGGWVDYFRGCEAVFHFAANPEVRVSVTDPKVHFQDNLLATFNVLEACRKHKVLYIVFASSSTVYGEARAIPTPEYYYPLEPISVYGACKLSCEQLISTYSRLYGLRSLSLRYANVIGPRSNHGVIIDFVRKLRKDPTHLEILGDGTQRKSYLYISDAVDATLHLFLKFIGGDKMHEVYNVGNDDWVTVREIADIVVEEMGLKGVRYSFKPVTPDGRGWPGDVKFMLLDISKLKSTGWSPKYDSKGAVREAVRALVNDEFPQVR